MENKEEKPETIFSILGFLALFLIYCYFDAKKRKLDIETFNENISLRKQLGKFLNEETKESKKES